MNSPQPILVGAGQKTVHSKSLEDFVHPIEAMRRVAALAAEDAGCPSLLEKADALHVVNILSWNIRDAPTALAEALGCAPKLKEYSSVGGNTPQWFVNRMADNLAAGRSEIAILIGCEVMRSVSLAMAAGADLGFFKDKVEAPMVGGTRVPINEVERAHYADRPIRVYQLIENALRAKEGKTFEQQRATLGRFGESYTAVAAENPYAWFPVRRTAEEIVTPTPKNRMISFPYTKYLNAIMAVDMAAAVIMTTDVVARRLGIPEEKWVYLHGGQDAQDLWHVSERADLAESPAIEACVADALAQAGLEIGDLSFFDFYSCFPCMPYLTRRVLGIDEDDPRPLTITGGLAYFGGPGNNFVTHCIAEALARCRKGRDAFGLITSNGWYCTKHCAGIYGARPPESPWKRTAPEKFQAELKLPESLELDAEPKGEFQVDSYTVWHSRQGGPERAILCGRTAQGRRAWAQTRQGDQDVLHAMMSEEWIGRRGKIVKREGQVNFAEFS